MTWRQQWQKGNIMHASVLSQIEERITQLSIDEQLWLIERVAQRLRESMRKQCAFNAELVAMAADPDIQRELHQIDKEFAETESDGLETL
jgi:hypothetical protein